MKQYMGLSLERSVGACVSISTQVSLINHVYSYQQNLLPRKVIFRPI
jgi:hypothetical protein